MPFFLLCGEVLRGSEWAFPRPAEHRLAAYRLKLVALYGRDLLHFLDSKILLLFRFAFHFDFSISQMTSLHFAMECDIM